MDRLLTNHLKNLKAFDNQRKGWLLLSAFVIVSILGILFLPQIHPSYAIWILSSLGILLGVVWWYWTMRLIRFIIQYRIEESEILRDLVVDIKSIKTEVQKGLTK